VTPPLWLLVLLVGMGPFTMQVLIPVMPAIGAETGAGQAGAQLTLTLYLLGVAVGQLFYGPLSDRFGRRPLLLIGLAAYTAASLGAALAQGIGWLVAARVAQSLGACAGLVLARAIVRDVWPRDEAASRLGYIVMGMTIMPMLGPLAGAMLDALAGWRATLLACAALGAALFAAVAWRLPETLREPQGLPGIAGLAAMWSGLARVPEFRAQAAVVACSTGVFYAFMGGAPYVVITGMGHSPAAYATAFMMISVTFAAGSFAAGRLSASSGTARMVEIGLVAITLGAMSSLVLQVAADPPIWLYFLPMAVTAFGNGISQPNALAAALSVRPQLAGTASGLVGAWQMALGAAMTLLVGVIETGSGIATAAAMAACGVGAQLAQRATTRG
jgi:DHA1 family bicyclomycin/chloramphenicol resistance-like MFS transporter